MKALAKDRERRYASVSALANDVQRHLRDEPLLAGPPSARYRLAKFVRRHRGLIGAAAVSVGALLIGLGVAVAALFQTRTERDTAEQARLAAERPRADRGREPVPGGHAYQRRHRTDRGTR